MSKRRKSKALGRGMLIGGILGFIIVAITLFNDLVLKNEFFDTIISYFSPHWYIWDLLFGSFTINLSLWIRIPSVIIITIGIYILIGLIIGAIVKTTKK